MSLTYLLKATPLLIIIAILGRAEWESVSWALTPTILLWMGVAESTAKKHFFTVTTGSHNLLKFFLEIPSFIRGECISCVEWASLAAFDMYV